MLPHFAIELLPLNPKVAIDSHTGWRRRHALSRPHTMRLARGTRRTRPVESDHGLDKERHPTKSVHRTGAV